MLKKNRIYLLAFIALSFSVSAVAQTYTPKQGSSERKALMDALRIPVEKELNKKVVFKVDHLKVQGNFAFMRGVPQQPSGARMDYRGTAYQQAIKAGFFDDWICALWRNQNGKWQVVRYVIGATDVVYEEWDKEYGAPSAIFR
jgi:hypothetical protein